MAVSNEANNALVKLGLFNVNVLAQKNDGIIGGNKFGETDDLQIASGYVPIWEPAIPYPYQTSAYQPYIASTNTNDTLLGTGAQKVVIQGNDPDGYFQIEELEMAGQTPVQSTKLWSRNYRMYVSQVDDATVNGSALGQIYLGLGTFTLGIPTTILAQINNGNNQTQMCIYTVPKGYHIAITNISFTTANLKPVRYRDMARLCDTPFDYTKPLRNVRSVQVVATYNQKLEPFGIFPELTDLQVQGLAEQNNTECEAAFRYILIPNKYFE